MWILDISGHESPISLQSINLVEVMNCCVSPYFEGHTSCSQHTVSLTSSTSQSQEAFKSLLCWSNISPVQHSQRSISNHGEGTLHLTFPTPSCDVCHNAGDLGIQVVTELFHDLQERWESQLVDLEANETWCSRTNQLQVVRAVYFEIAGWRGGHAQNLHQKTNQTSMCSMGCWSFERRNILDRVSSAIFAPRTII